MLWARDVTVRNNVFDGTGSGGSYIGVTIGRQGSEPPPVNIQMYNNTIYKSDTTNDAGYNMYLGTDIKSTASHVKVFNNLLTFPSTGELVSIMRNNGTDVTESGNLLTDTPLLSNPDLSDPLSRDYSLQAESPAIDFSDETIPVLDDFLGISRIGPTYDIGAFVYEHETH